MCLLAVLFRTIPGAPVLVAANREERFDRPSLPPHVQPGPPRVLCGLDEEAGGTWLGVNEHGLIVAATNRRKSALPSSPRSRGLLCRELLGCGDASAASELALRDLSTDRYAGANYVCLDPRQGFVVYGGDELRSFELEPGLHLMTNGDLDDPEDERQGVARRLLEAAPPGSTDEFLARAADVCGHPGIVVRREDGGTVSSDLIAVTHPTADAVYRHAPGPPDATPYEDCSAALRRMLAQEVPAIAPQRGPSAGRPR